MKIKEGYVLQEIGGTKVAIYIGSDRGELNGFAKLNPLAVFLWERLEKGCGLEELVRAVTDRYDVDSETAARDAEAFLAALREKNILCE